MNRNPEPGDAFDGSDYALGYLCVAPNRICASESTICEDGVWFRNRVHGLLQSAHRRCLTAVPDSDPPNRIEHDGCICRNSNGIRDAVGMAGESGA